MGRQGLVRLVRQGEMNWDSLPSETGSFRISRPFTSRESPTIGGGLVVMESCEVPWMPNYDEVVVVLEGEMTIRHDGEDYVAHAGDMYLIRYGAEIVYKTDSRATFAWVLYPAQWKNLRWPE